MGLSVGESIPHFTLITQDGTSFSSKEALEQGPLVIFFYPKDYTPGCTAEACNFRDFHAEFRELGAQVVGVSTDSTKRHSSFANRYNLTYPLLTDDDGKLAKSFGVKKKFFNLLPGRETFVVDTEGIIRLSYADLKAANHHEKALETLREL